MKRKILFYILFVGFIIIIQTSFDKLPGLFGVKPNFVVFITVFAAMTGGAVEGGIAGIVTGLVFDVMSGGAIGFHALALFYTGLLLGYLNKQLYRDNIFLIMSFVFAVSIVYEVYVYLFGFSANGMEAFAYALKRVILPEAFVNALWVLPLYPLSVRYKGQKKELKGGL